MTIPLARPLVCPILVGRDAHLEGLERVLDPVRSGCGRTVLVTGEAGIGKSRLVSEIRCSALRRGFTSLDGYCFEPDRALPYAPLLDLLRNHLADRSSDRIAQELGAAARELVKLLPEIAALLPGLTPTPALEPEREQHRLFHAVAQWLEGLAAAQPLLAIVEDLHWSDDTSLALLLFLARRVASQPILLLCTYRSDETDAGLGHFLAEVDRGRLATEVALPRLDRREVGLMVRAIGEPRRPVAAGFVDLVYASTDGNPFFIEEVLGSLPAGPDAWDGKLVGELPVPRSVHDAVRRRTARLRPAAREILRLAAVAGRRFDFALLHALTRQTERELLDIMKHLLAAQLVVEELDDRFAFRHALTRQAILSELLGRERRTLHYSIAKTIERVHADALERHRADLAYHYFEAGAWAKALAHARRAGEQAQALYAPREAIEHFTRALDATARLSTFPPAELYRARAQAYRMLGAFEAARADHEAALARARAAGDRRAEWQTLLQLGQLWTARDYTRTGECYRQALDLARDLDEPAALARSSNRLGNWYVNVEQPLVGLRHHEEALAIFEAVADRRGIAETLDLVGMARCCSGDLLGSMATYARAATLLRELDDRSTLVLSLAVLASAAGDGHFDPLATDPAEFARAVSAGEEARAIARDMEWAAGEAFAGAQLGQCLGTRGEYGRALAAAQEAHRIAAMIEDRQRLAFAHEVLGRLYLDLLALSAARRHLERALVLAREVGSRIWLNAASGALVSTCVQQGDLARAKAVLAVAPAFAEPPRSFGQRLLACARAELALARREPARALRLADQVRASLEPQADGALHCVGPPHLRRLLGETLAALGRVAEAESVFQADVAAARARGCLPLLWRVHLALARLHREGGRRADAEREIDAARETIEELAAIVPGEPAAELDGRSLREHFLQAATERVHEAGRPRSAKAAARPPDGLTPREIEVLRLLAGGRSNREIAGELVISVRTVEHHVSNIYSKIGARRRARATAYALRRGLLLTGGPE